jgi:hypothetical protein
MRAKEWSAVCPRILFVGVGLVWLVWGKIAAAIDDRPVARIVDVVKTRFWRGVIYLPAGRADGRDRISLCGRHQPQRAVEGRKAGRREGQCLALQF